VASFLRPPSAAGKAGLDRFLAEDGYLVTTGQQPGLFGGPLYSLYKALTAIKLAQTLESVLGRPVLALFWVASEDHDWAEADHTHLLDRENELHTFRVPEQAGYSSQPLHRIPVETGLEDTLADFLQDLPDTEFTSSFVKLIRGAYSPGATLSEGFTQLMEGLLAEQPIVFTDAGNQALKEHSRALLLSELEGAETKEALLHRVTSHLEMDGYKVQVPILEGGVNLFLEGPSGRDRLYRDGSAFRLNHAGTSLSLDEIRALVEENPSLLSPNVLLRPVVESALFPTLSYVAGPGETAYYAQLKDYFGSHGIRMPVIFPRHGATLVESKVGKVLDKFQLALEGLNRPFDQLAGDIAREEVPPEIRRSLGEIRGAIGKGAGALTKATQGIDPTLKGPVTHARNAAYQAFDEAEKKILQAVKRQNEIALGQLEKAQRNLFPGGKPQERVLNPFYYLARYGPDLIPALLDEFHVALGTEPA
jgi:bacillithiol biosynthesis cysteine-adding enzyme BshC